VESLLALERAALVRAVDDVHRRRVVVVELGAVGHLGRLGSLRGLWGFGTSDFSRFSVHAGVFPDAELCVALGFVDGDFGAVLAGKFASITITPRFHCVRSRGEFVKVTQLVINVTGDVVVGALPESSFAFHRPVVRGGVSIWALDFDFIAGLIGANLSAGGGVVGESTAFCVV